MKRQNIFLLVVIVAALVVAGTAYTRQKQKAQDIIDDSSVRTLVGQFGTTMQKVSLAAPDALTEIETAYSPYAAPSLIKNWQSNRSFAPGRALSSPWPSNINIAAVTKQKDGSYKVQGMVIEVTSLEVAHGGIAAEFPVTITLKKFGDQWLMTDYQRGVETTFAAKVPAKTQ